jgi:hypothetical protein
MVHFQHEYRVKNGGFGPESAVVGMPVSDCGEFENHTIFEYTDQFMTRIRA